ncbi:MAG: type II toxin-antitoxin system RelE/ParE family toxin [Bacteroidetes bacterium]|jgi:mRNA-degrading endonuclease RelE of RelBE toxin-antitoxin system|nr:type II toxin-antitoxin system RelE/ParE family toxin [Bacteroidota bacterium]
MSYNIFTIAYFDKQLKRLVKKYPSLKAEFSELVSTLKTDPTQGVSIGNGCYKLRISIASKGKGKSGGARVITYVAITENSVFLLSIYDKSEQEDISDKELLRLLNIIR